MKSLTYLNLLIFLFMFNGIHSAFHHAILKRNRYVERSKTASCTLRCRSKITVGVCQGSTCMGKCKGDFNPLTIFKNLATGSFSDIEINEIFCLDACKRGPNVRLYQDGHITSIEAMTDLEKTRKMFTAVSREADVHRVWAFAVDLASSKIPCQLFTLAPDGRYLEVRNPPSDDS